MVFALLYLVLGRLFGLAGGSAFSDQSKEVEILVLRHQLKILRRRAARPRLRRLDRILLAAASRALPRGSWASFLVTFGSAHLMKASGISNDAQVRPTHRKRQRSSSTAS